MVIPLLLHGKHANPPVTYQPFGPWIVPWQFHSFEEDYRTLGAGVGLIDYSTQALIEIQGADRVSFLHSLLTHDIKRLAPGEGCQAALLTDTAKMIADLLVLADSDRHWLLCDLTRASIVVETLDRYVLSAQVTQINHERAWAVMALQGPRTIELATQLCHTVVSLPHAGHHGMYSLEGLSIRLVRHTLTGGVGLLCLVKAAQAECAWELLQRRGGSFGLRLVGWDALNTARIEAGIPWYGVDVSEANLLPETGLEAMVASETKGCYLGQEIVARMQTYGSANKKLVGLLLDGRQLAEPGDAITRDGQPVGTITSACDSPALQRPIAMGYLKRGSYEPGTAVEVIRGNTRIAATVATRPLVAPK